MTVSPLIVRNDAWRSVQVLNELYLLRTTDDGCITPSVSADEERYCVDTTTRKRRGSVFVLSFLGVRLCYDEEVKETHGGESSPEGEREGRCDIASAIKGTNHQM